MPEYDTETYWEILDRQKEILNKKEQLKLKNSQITVIGCGGIGGASIEMLARMGIGNLRIVDKDVFDTSNINRQLMSNFDSVGRPKTEVTKEKVQSINPFIKVKTINEELDQNNVSRIIKGSDIVLDALDNLLSRIFVSRCASKLDIPFIHGAIHGTMGQLSVFTRKTPSYEKSFQLPSEGKSLTDDVISEIIKLNRGVPPVIGPVPNIVGCIQAFEAVKIITGKGKTIMAPRVLIFDLMKEEAFSIVRF